MQWQSLLRSALEQRKRTNLWRQPHVLASSSLNFCSNDYLSLSQHPKVIAAYQHGLAEYGVGSGGSPLISGYQRSHHQLCEKLADWLGRDKVLLTNSGYAANHAVTAALSSLNPRYVFDKRNHASMYDAVQANGNTLVRFNHNDLRQAAKLLDSGESQLQVLASEGVFSMDGDSLPIKPFIALGQAGNGNILTWVDDAHGLGVVGPGGRGVAGESTQDEVNLITATFGKALGIGGAFVAGSSELIEACWQHARHYIYSTAFSAAQANAISCALDVLTNEPEHKQRLDKNISYLKQGLLNAGWRTEQSNASLQHAIQPIHCGNSDAALALSQRLSTEGISCVAIRPPTVPANQAGIRVTLNAGHSKTDIDKLLNALGNKEAIQEHVDVGP